MSWDEPPTAGSTRHVNALDARGDPGTRGVDVGHRPGARLPRPRPAALLVLQRPPSHVPDGEPAGAGDGGLPGVLATRGDGGRRVRTTGFASMSRPTARASSWRPARTSGRSRSSRPACRAGSRPSSTTGSSGKTRRRPPISRPVTDLASGNTLYDAELLRRIDARRYPDRPGRSRLLRPDGRGQLLPHHRRRDDAWRDASHLNGAVTATILESRRTNSMARQRSSDGSSSPASTCSTCATSTWPSLRCRSSELSSRRPPPSPSRGRRRQLNALAPRHAGQSAHDPGTYHHP